MRRRTRIINKFLFYTAAFMLLIVTSLAQAEPTMTIQYSTDDQGWFEYLVTNTSPQNPDYEMDEFILPAGSNQGVFYAVAPINWTFIIDANETIFTTNLSYIPPVNGQGFFELYSMILDVGQRDAIANTRFEGQFNPVSVDVPVERTLEADIYFDGIVNFRDFAVLAGEWQQEEDWYSPPYFGGGPVMEIDSDIYVGPDFGFIGSYTVTNTSPQAEHNNMIEFTLPAGTNQGVYDAVAPTGWLLTINSDNTVFTGNGNYIAPGNQELFELYSTDLNIHQDYAEADGSGPPDGLTFDPVLVDVPGEYLRTLEADIYFDGIVDANDLRQMTDEWLITESWYVP